MYFLQNKSIGNQALPSGRYPLCVAADYGQTDVISYLINNGADVNVSSSFSFSLLKTSFHCITCVLSEG